MINRNKKKKFYHQKHVNYDIEHEFTDIRIKLKGYQH